MAIIFYDGFDHWQPGGVGVVLPAVSGPVTTPSTGWPLQWAGYGGTVTTVAGMDGHCLHLGTSPSYLLVNAGGSSSWVIGARIKQTALATNWGSAVFRLRDYGGWNDACTCSVDASGYVVIYAGDQATELARSSAPVVAAGGTYYLEFKYDARTNPYLLEARLDGAVVARCTPFAGVLPFSTVNQIMLTGDRFYDDFYLLTLAVDSTAPWASDYLGPCVVELWLPATDSETGLFAFTSGSPPVSWSYGVSGFGLQTIPPLPRSSLGTTSGDQFAAKVATQYPAGDSRWIGSRMQVDAISATTGNVTHPNVGAPLVFRMAPTGTTVPRAIYAVQDFVVASGDGITDFTSGVLFIMPQVSFGLNVPLATSPYYGRDADAGGARVAHSGAATVYWGWTATSPPAWTYFPGGIFVVNWGVNPGLPAWTDGTLQAATWSLVCNEVDKGMSL